jgi:hypothetical protein
VFDLLREHTSDMYMIQEENVAAEGGGAQYNNKRGFNYWNKGNFGRGRGRGAFGRGGQGPIICYNCNQPGNLARDCKNICTTCTYCREMDHSTKYCPQLVVRWHGRGNPKMNHNQNVNMVSFERSNEGPKVEFFTHGGARTWNDMMNQGNNLKQWVRNSVGPIAPFYLQ